MRGVAVTWFWVVGVVAVVYLLHRLAVWAEGRGWIYYRTNRMPAGAAGRAMMELSAIVEPEVEHVIEQIDSEKVTRDQSRSGEPEADG